MWPATSCMSKVARMQLVPSLESRQFVGAVNLLPQKRINVIIIPTANDSIITNFCVYFIFRPDANRKCIERMRYESIVIYRNENDRQVIFMCRKRVPMKFRSHEDRFRWTFLHLRFAKSTQSLCRFRNVSPNDRTLRSFCRFELMSDWNCFDDLFSAMRGSLLLEAWMNTFIDDISNANLFKY